MYRRAFIAAATIAGLATSYAALATSAAFYFYPPRVITKVIQFDPATAQIITVQPGGMTKQSHDIIFENYLRTYVAKRETIDHTTGEERRAWLSLYTNPEWYSAWNNATDPREPTSPHGRYAREGLTRQISNIVASPIPDAPRKWRVDFTATDRLFATGEAVRSRQWTATIQVTEEATKGQPAQVAKNPLGMTVYNYVLREVPK